MAGLDFASIAKFFVFLLIGVSMLMGLDSMGTPATNDTMYGVYHTVTSLISLGYGMFAIGGIIIGAATVLSFTDYIRDVRNRWNHNWRRRSPKFY